MKKQSDKSWWEFIAFSLFVGGLTVYLILSYPQFFIYLHLIKQTDAQGRNYHLRDFGVQMPQGYQIHGIDVSRYQEEIDWEAAAKMRIKGIQFEFVFMKATEGERHRDRFFQYNWQRAKEQKLIRGAYHFYNPNINSAKQAKLFISQVTLEKGDLPPVLDIEQTGKYTTSNLRKGLKNWLNIIEKEYGLRPIIYTNQNFYRDYLQGHFEEYPCWIARYGGVSPEYPSPEVWSFWQHTDQGLVNGIAGEVDLNVFRGSREALEKLCKR